MFASFVFYAPSMPEYKFSIQRGLFQISVFQLRLQVVVISWGEEMQQQGFWEPTLM